MLKPETDEMVSDLLREERENETERILDSPPGKRLWSRYKNLLEKILSCRWKKKDIPKPQSNIEIRWSQSSDFIHDVWYYPVLGDDLREQMEIPSEIYTARLLISSPVSKYPSATLVYNHNSSPAEIKLKFGLDKTPPHFSFFVDGHSSRYIMTGYPEKDSAISLLALNIGYRPEPHEIFNQLYKGIVQFEPIVSGFVNAMSKSTPTVLARRSSP